MTAIHRQARCTRSRSTHHCATPIDSSSKVPATAAMAIKAGTGQPEAIVEGISPHGVGEDCCRACRGHPAVHLQAGQGTPEHVSLGYAQDRALYGARHEQRGNIDHGGRSGAEHTHRRRDSESRRLTDSHTTRPGSEQGGAAQQRHSIECHRTHLPASRPRNHHLTAWQGFGEILEPSSRESLVYANRPSGVLGCEACPAGPWHLREGPSCGRLRRAGATDRGSDRGPVSDGGSHAQGRLRDCRQGDDAR